MRFFYLFIVGVLNLVIGVAIARWLMRQSAHDPSVELTPEQALEKLVAELDLHAAEFDEQSRAVDTGQQPVDELETIASEVNSQVRLLLQLVNSVVDALSNDEAADDHGEAIEQLESCWSDINYDAVQLVTLTFDEESAAETRATLAKACRGLGAASRMAADRLKQHPPVLFT